MVNPISFPTPQAYSGGADFSMLANLGNVYKKAQEDARQQEALGKLGPDGYELVTVYRGQQASDAELANLESEIRANYPRLEVEVQQGDQQHYPFILSVE